MHSMSDLCGKNQINLPNQPFPNVTRLHRDRPALAQTLDRLNKPLVVPQVRLVATRNETNWVMLTGPETNGGFTI